MAASREDRKKESHLRPDLPGGRKRKGDHAAEDESTKDAMSGRGDDRRHARREGGRGRKKRGFGDQGGWI